MINADILTRYSLFGGLDASQIKSILDLTTYASYKPCDIILKEGTPNDSIHFILNGRVEISKRGIVLAQMAEGQAFGEMELLDIQPSAATVTALTQLELAIISNKCIHTIYKNDIKVFAMLMMNLARDLSRRLRRMDDIVCS